MSVCVFGAYVNKYICVDIGVYIYIPIISPPLPFILMLYNMQLASISVYLHCFGNETADPCGLTHVYE